MNKFTVFLFIISIAFFAGCSDNTNNTAVKITPGIEKYSAFMSSVPGFPLTAELEKRIRLKSINSIGRLMKEAC